jgi:hypothetical protein
VEQTTGHFQFDVSFPMPLPKLASHELARRIYYLSDQIRGFSLIEDRDALRGIRLEVETQDAKAELEEVLLGVLYPSLVRLRQREPRVVWCDEGVEVIHPNLLGELVKRGQLTVHGPGQVGFSGYLLQLLELIDETFAALSTGAFNAVTYRFPTLLSTKALRRSGYFERFPQFLFFANRMRNSKDNFDRFAAHTQCCSHPEDGEDYTEFTSASGTNLPPTMCYYVYQMLSDSTFDKNQAVTAVGKSFRHENRYANSLNRLWDFTIRETVFLGEQSYVDGSVTAYRDAAISLARNLGLKGRCESATDPFFVAGGTIDLANSQRLTGAKFELRLGGLSSESVAVGSFNYHSQYIARAFNLQSAGEPAGRYNFTGCIGICLERFALACVAQWGPDQGLWPEHIRERLRERQEQAESIRARARTLFNIVP